MSSSAAITQDRDTWNDAVLAHGGHFLQSWGWGAFKSSFGWDVARVATEHGVAQVLLRRKAGASVGYIPRGPAHANAEGGARLWQAIGREAVRRRALFVIVEANE
ncbi:MAG: peptidoglycan bridge formation glycyltransferase FemA/FemB family protein, partial [Thermomicrobiales bacterium]|nr:peptidoglycan bridge formation glycyltransferase FemA/FemB family protein [Thermomicrobiales bacterium]